MDRSKKRIAIIGSGITGLATAYRLKQIIDKEQLSIELMVLEATPRSGGSVFSMKMGEYYVDLGAESIDNRVGGGIAKAFIEEIGLAEKIEYSQNGKPDIFAFNKLYTLEYPTYKGIPAKRSDIWKNDILSFRGKLNYLRNSKSTSKTSKENMRIIDYLNRRVGKELAEYVGEPFFSKIYSSDVDKLGIQAANDPIVELEQKHGQLTEAIQDHPEWLDGSGNYMTFKNGLETLTNSLAEKLKDSIQYSKKVTEIKKSIEGTYIVDINKKEQVRVGAVIVATDAKAYADLFAESDFTEYFRSINRGSIGYILLGFPKGSVKKEPNGFGILSPRRNDSYISSVIWLNKKWDYLKDVSDELIGVHFGQGNEDIVMSLSNKQIEEAVLRDLGKMLGIKDEPLYKVIKRWPSAIPQFSAKHKENRENMFTFLSNDYPGVYLAGNGIDGFGIPSCIKQAEAVSQLALDHIKKQNSI